MVLSINKRLWPRLGKLEWEFNLNVYLCGWRELVFHRGWEGEPNIGSTNKQWSPTRAICCGHQPSNTCIPASAPPSDCFFPPICHNEIGGTEILIRAGTGAGERIRDSKTGAAPANCCLGQNLQLLNQSTHHWNRTCSSHHSSVRNSQKNRLESVFTWTDNH